MAADWILFFLNFLPNSNGVKKQDKGIIAI
jgi:hypothetical protein